MLCRECRGRRTEATGEVRFKRSSGWGLVEIRCLDCHHAWFSTALGVQHVADRIRREALKRERLAETVSLTRA